MQIKKIIYGSIFGFLLILFVISLIFPPTVQFSYILGEISYSVILFILALIAFIIFIQLFDEKRESKIYLDENGDLDVETPREYIPLSITPVSKVFGRANIYGQKNLDYFSYKDGKVCICNSKGQKVNAPLKDLEFIYKYDKNKVTDEWYIYQFKIKDSEGNTTQFNRHHFLFNEEEYDDIELLLSLSGKVKEAGISKFTKIASGVVDAARDLNFSDLSTSIVETIKEKATEKVVNTVGQVAKKRIFDKLSGKKRSLFKRLIGYFWLCILCLIGILLIWINVENWVNAHSNSGYDEYETIEMNDSMVTEDSQEAAAESSLEVVLTGKIGSYPIEMKLDLKDINEPSWCEVEGVYRYTTTGNGSLITVEGVKQYENLDLTEVDTNGNPTGYFYGTLTIIGRLASFIYEGTFVTTKDKSYEFHLTSE